jgi:mRNA-degrading endonuclease YafQ of YafQ-DinJ toxin-antitoxin module
MYTVEFENKQAQDTVEAMIRNGELNQTEQSLLHEWVRQVAFHGPTSLQGAKQKWNDHALEGNWAGYRASAFSNRGRIIYRVEGQTVRVLIARVTTTHNYKR